MTDSMPSHTTPYLADIASQPAVLAELLEGGLSPEVRALLARLGDFERIVLTGMGASLHALRPSHLRLVERGLPVWMAETSDLLGAGGGLLTPRTLVWAVSQSGRSAEIVALLEALRAPRPVVLGVTSDTTSPLGLTADVVLELRSGEEQTVGTKSYLNTLGAQALAVAAATGAPAPRAVLEAPAELEAYISDFERHVDELGAAVAGETTFVVGRGASVAAAATGALIVKEAAKAPCEGMSAPQFRHGPLEMVGPSVDVLVLEGSGADRALNRRTLDDVRRLGSSGVWLAAAPGEGPAAPALTGEARPLGEIVPLQALSVALARRRGVTPGAFHHIDKVTRTL